MTRSLTAKVLALTTTALLLLSPTPANARSVRHRLLDNVNTVRVNHSVHRVRLVARLTRIAERHSSSMARRRTLSHSSRRPCRTWGEIVGQGGTIGGVWRAFMNSPTHRRIILTARWRRVGIGSAHAGGRWWVTMIFCTG